jgi:hypothetical protein
MLRKQRTVAIPKSEIDFMVQEFYCHDSAVLQSLGSHHQEMRWNIVAGLGTPPLELKIMTDGGLVHSTKVGVVAGLDEAGRPRQVFPLPGPNGHTKEKLKEDVRWSQKFRGSVADLNKKHFYEVRLPDQLGGYRWNLATVTHQRMDYVEAVVAMTDQYETAREVHFPAVAMADVREAASKKPLSCPERVLSLEVPKANPLHATLAVDGEPITHFFGRPTPPPSKEASSNFAAGTQTLRLKVDKARKRCTGNFSTECLSDFLKSEVQLVESQSTRLKHTWTISLGQTAEHVIEIEKKWSMSKIVTVSVDGSRMVEAKAEDLECPTHEFVCNFCLVGERFLEFEVHETNADGIVLDSTGVARSRMKVMKHCSVHIPDENDFNTAVLLVEGVPFSLMQDSRKPKPGDSIDIAPEVLLSVYGIRVPFKVNEAAHAGLQNITDSLVGFLVSGGNSSSAVSIGSPLNIFAYCSGAPADSTVDAHALPTAH